MTHMLFMLELYFPTFLTTVRVNNRYSVLESVLPKQHIITTSQNAERVFDDRSPFCDFAREKLFSPRKNFHRLILRGGSGVVEEESPEEQLLWAARAGDEADLERLLGSSGLNVNWADRKSVV